jgi:hypothetical protein
MNERIRHLAIISGIDIRGHMNGVPFLDQKPSVCDLEKFADTMIKECADIAKFYVMNISTYGDAEYVEEQIKKHFEDK